MNPIRTEVDTTNFERENINKQLFVCLCFYLVVSIWGVRIVFIAAGADQLHIVLSAHFYNFGKSYRHRREGSTNADTLK